MVPTAKEILFSMIFPETKLPFSSIQDLKAINQDMCEKAHHIYSMYGQLLTF